MGTNLGDKASNLAVARTHLNNTAGKINKLSMIYETAAWGKTNQPSFYNQVVVLKTNLSPKELLDKIHEIETEMGRIRYEKWGERIIDIDILFYGDEVLKLPALRIPHPEIQNRRFTLEPLAEIAPNLQHPELQVSITELLNSCPDHLEVKPVKLSP